MATAGVERGDVVDQFQGGADNIAVFVPLFDSLGTVQLLLTLTVFVAMFGLWCAVATWLGTRLSAVRAVRRLGSRVIPIVFIAVGAIILAQAAIP
ncbi:cadmium resistance transporter [Solihabitans fulvus]|uniref:cadmium resistance transporter n=1 Tax=Solihabitans fulvus TaxID=1892852 RepID=UPI0016621993|nr:cadmium resistance transporter [Solihabitans fulvus]